MEFQNFQAVVERGIARQLHYGVQLSLSASGQTWDLAFGESSPGQNLNPDDNLCWLSAAKPLTAVLCLQLVEQGVLDLHRPLQVYLPEWAGPEPGRQQVTTWHLLTHTSPLPEIVGNSRELEELPRSELIRLICQTPLKPDWEPGKRAAYLPRTSWFLLGEIVERLSGHSFEDQVQEKILTPLKMNSTHCRFDAQTPLPRLYDRVRAELQVSEYARQPEVKKVSPGSSFYGPARELRQFYAALNDDLQGAGNLLSAELASLLISRQRQGIYDETLQHIVDYGLGVILDSKQYGRETVPYGFGDLSSSETFGHGGSQCAIGYADPVRQRSVVIIANGRCGEGQHQRRFRELLSALEQDLFEG